MSSGSIDHPNIVRFVGLCALPDKSGLPAIVMELMSSNLHEFLLNTQNIPLSLKHSILGDVANGLHFLHNHQPDPIIHRDLTATNVLLHFKSSCLMAKISDFGTSRFLPSTSTDTAKLTKQPGTLVYMPLEAGRDDYDFKLDIFSFGHLALFVLLQVSKPCIILKSISR